MTDTILVHSEQQRKLVKGIYPKGDIYLPESVIDSRVKDQTGAAWWCGFWWGYGTMLAVSLVNVWIRYS